jgi:hypothetical protein
MTRRAILFLPLLLVALGGCNALMGAGAGSIPGVDGVATMRRTAGGFEAQITLRNATSSPLREVTLVDANVEGGHLQGTLPVRLGSCPVGGSVTHTVRFGSYSGAGKNTTVNFRFEYQADGQSAFGAYDGSAMSYL